MAGRRIVDGSRGPNIQHSAKTTDWGTNRKVLDVVRYVLGGIDLDPFSSSYWNHYTVKASRFYDRRQNGLKQPWSGRVLLNPPGTDDADRAAVGAFDRRSVPRQCWERAIEDYRYGRIDCLMYIGFSLEQLTLLQGSMMHPLQFVSLIPCERQPFLAKCPRNGPPIEGGSPTHGNFITLLPGMRSRTEARDRLLRFREVSSNLAMVPGALVRPV